MPETFGAHRAGATFQRRGFCSDEPEEPERTRPACRQRCRGGAGRPRLCKLDRRACRDRVAGCQEGGTVAARSDRLPRACGAEQPAADIGGHETVSVLGGPKRLVREPDELYRASTAASDVAFQPKR